MNSSIFPRLFCVLVALTMLALRAQDHAEPEKKSAPAPRQAKGGGRANADADGGVQARSKQAAVTAADLSVDLEKIIANPAELAKGQKIFELQCGTCHGPKGEGSRGPTLAQPKLPRASDNRSLLGIIQGGIPGTEMPNARLRPGEAPYVAAYVRALGRMPIDKVPGDAAKGAALFQTKGACLTCHTLEGKGPAIGPDLTDIGLRRGAAFMRRSLAEPGAEVPQSFLPFRAEISIPLNFMFVRVKTKEGKEVSGVRINENTYSIQLRDLTGAMYSFQKSELAELHKDQGASPMPAYGGIFTPAEMDDVIAYLVSLRGENKTI
ncbi:MAG: c-type cytochrome [Opitutus sp.]|nr:c-type cytochrome [Opitutus sp.]